MLHNTCDNTVHGSSASACMYSLLCVQYYGHAEPVVLLQYSKEERINTPEVPRGGERRVGRVSIPSLMTQKDLRRLHLFCADSLWKSADGRTRPYVLANSYMQ